MIKINIIKYRRYKLEEKIKPEITATVKYKLYNVRNKVGDTIWCVLDHIVYRKL